MGGAPLRSAVRIVAMVPLPAGVTGFNPPEHEVDFKGFKQVCYETARRLKGRVHEVRAAYEEVTPNFHEAILSFYDDPERVRIICNAHFPIVAFCRPATREGDIQLEYIDCAKLADQLRDSFTVLSAAEASAGVSSELTSNLGEAELDQMRYWSPQRIGDVIFNHWD